MHGFELRQDIEGAMSRSGVTFDGDGKAEIVAGFESLWSAALDGGASDLTPSRLRAEISELALTARELGVEPEKFVSMVKESWTALPEVRGSADVLKTRDLLSGIVTICIHEFFRD